MGHLHHVSLMLSEGGSLEDLPTYMITYTITYIIKQKLFGFYQPREV